MTYRDDTALHETCDALAGEVTAMEDRLAQLVRRREELDIYIHHARRGLVIRSIRKWAADHRRALGLMVLLLSIVAGTSVAYFFTTREPPPQPVQISSDCKTRLQVDASHPGAVVSLDGRRLGAVPVDTRVCPGRYRLHLAHPQTLPWQVILRVVRQQKIEYTTQLISRSIPRHPGTLVFSRPPGALVFADGVEVGWTPVFVRSPATNTDLLRLGLTHPDRAPGVWQVPPREAVCLYLGPPRPEATP